MGSSLAIFCAQRLLHQTEVAGTFSPGWSHQSGLKVYFYSRLVAPTGSKGLPPGRGCARGWQVTFSPGWSHQPGLKVPPLYPGRLLLPPRARAQHILKLTAVVFLLPPPPLFLHPFFDSSIDFFDSSVDSSVVKVTNLILSFFTIVLCHFVHYIYMVLYCGFFHL